VVIGTDGKGSCSSNKHTTMMALQTDGIALRNMQNVAAFTLKRAKVPFTVNNSLQQYMIHVVSDLWQVGDFLMVFRFPPPINLTAVI
jgi:hypothetical protein